MALVAALILEQRVLCLGVAVTCMMSSTKAFTISGSMEGSYRVHEARERGHNEQIPRNSKKKFQAQRP